MNVLTSESLRQLYRLNAISRYNTWQRVKNESVSEHSYYVVLFTKIIVDNLHIRDENLSRSELKALALDIAITHDLPEIITNDITYNAKCAIPKLKTLMDEYEREFLKNNFPQLYDIKYNGGEEAKLVELAICIAKLADILSAIQYCDNEVILGNLQFNTMLAENKVRAKDQIAKIEKGYDVVCQGIMI